MTGAAEVRIPAWRREPYRVFFPLGALLAWAGVLHWGLHALGWLPEYRPVFHSIAQIQGFLISFALGFLFTAIPRRTGTAPPAAWEVLICAAAAVGTALAAWFRAWGLSQAIWAVLVFVFLQFAIRRFRAAEAARRPPNSFVWIPASFAIGLGGAILTGVYGILGPGAAHLHDLGRMLLLQGTFLGLVMGVGGLVFPLLTRGQGPPDGSASTPDRLARAGHLGAGLVLLLSFLLENYASARAGLFLRGALVLAVLCAGAEIWRWPRVPGWHRRLVWLSAWMIPLGYLIAGLFPDEKKAGLHVVFVGGFALMALSVGLHVTLAHGGDERLVRGKPWQVPVFGGLFLAAAVLRAAADFDRSRFFLWIGAASAAFLAATIFWAGLALPWWIRPQGSEGHRPG